MRMEFIRFISIAIIDCPLYARNKGSKVLKQSFRLDESLYFQ